MRMFIADNFPETVFFEEKVWTPQSQAFPALHKIAYKIINEGVIPDNAQASVVRYICPGHLVEPFDMFRIEADIEGIKCSASYRYHDDSLTHTFESGVGFDTVSSRGEDTPLYEAAFKILRHYNFRDLKKLLGGLALNC
jgi:hypothetical protein